MACSSLQKGIRAVAVMEAAKGLLVVAVGFGVLSLLHRDVEVVAERLVHRFHLNPASHYPRIFLEAADRVTDARLWMIAAGAFTYAAVRFVEGYGLWHCRRWAEWFGVISAGLYLPIEVVHLARHLTWPSVVLVLVNVFVVLYLGLALRKPHAPIQTEALLRR